MHTKAFVHATDADSIFTYAISRIIIYHPLDTVFVSKHARYAAGLSPIGISICRFY